MARSDDRGAVNTANRVESLFSERFGGAPKLLAEAPGRVNLIGEHTDYNDGFVLPCTIGDVTVVAARARADRRVVLRSADFEDDDEFELGTDLKPREAGHWANYARGIVACLVQAGHTLGGAEMLVSGTVPKGMGLSSSASFEMAVAKALRALFSLAVSDTELAKHGQRAEQTFAGCSCGIMDQLTSIVGVAQHAMLIDCRTLALRAIPLPSDVAFMVLGSGVARELSDSKYNLRRQECEQAARALDAAALRDVSAERLAQAGGELDPVLMKRARHVVSENDRTLAAAAALSERDLVGLARLMRAAHASFRDDFEASIPQVDRLVDIYNERAGEQGAARLTGGGFGGCVIGVAERSRARAIYNDVSERYSRENALESPLVQLIVGPDAPGDPARAHGRDA